MNTAVVIGVGASNGLGAAIARRFAAGGLHTVVVGRSQDKLDAVAAEINATGPRAPRTWRMRRGRTRYRPPSTRRMASARSRP